MITSTEAGMLDIHATAERLGVSPATVRRMVQRGALPAYQIGGQWRFREEEIEAYIERQRVPPRRKDESED